MRLLAHPFRLDGTVFATVEQGSEEHVQQSLAMLLLTRRGERPLVPMLGILDPTFDSVDPGDVQMQVELFGPDVSILEVAVDFSDDSTQQVEITYA